MLHITKTLPKKKKKASKSIRHLFLKIFSHDDAERKTCISIIKVFRDITVFYQHLKFYEDGFWILCRGKKFCSQWFIKYKQICFSGTCSQGLDSGFWILDFFSPCLFFIAHYFLWVTEMWEMFDCRMENFLFDFFM